MQYRLTNREGVDMKDIILGGIFGAVIVFFVAVVYGFRVGVL
jgi:hypothetical protein